MLATLAMEHDALTMTNVLTTRTTATLTRLAPIRMVALCASVMMNTLEMVLLVNSRIHVLKTRMVVMTTLHVPLMILLSPAAVTKVTLVMAPLVKLFPVVILKW
jgi:hypothetical protein